MEIYKPRCTNCGERFKPRFKTTEKYCREHECIDAQAKEIVNKQVEKKQKQLKIELKEWGKRKKTLKPHTHKTDTKGALGTEIQKLARLIDLKFGFITCIDCGLPYGKQQDGGHFHSKGAHPTLRYNLHNIHSQKSNCNRNGMGGGKQHKYHKGLIQRYGKEYAEMVDTGFTRNYKYLGLKDGEYPEKLKLVRALIRQFDTYKFTDSLHARTMCNKIIGIYDEILFR